MNYILSRLILENSSSNKKVVSLNTVTQRMIPEIPFMYCYGRIILHFLGNFRLLQTNLVKCLLLLYNIITWGSTNLTMAYCYYVNMSLWHIVGTENKWWWFWPQRFWQGFLKLGRLWICSVLPFAVMGHIRTVEDLVLMAVLS